MLGSAVGSGGTRISKPASAGTGKLSRTCDVQARLDRLESLLEKAVSGNPSPQQSLPRYIRHEEHGHDSELSPSATSQTSQGAGISSDNHDGTLLLDGGQSKFVSSLHYALLADEIQDIKALLGDKTDENSDGPTQNNLIHAIGLGRARSGVSLEALMPDTQEQRDALLDIYFANVDPVIRITHRPSLINKLPAYVQNVHALVFAIFYSAINSLPPALVESRFGESKEELMAKYELGIEISLARGNYLTSPSLELLQAFVIWLTCITREEDIGKAWALLGIAIRIALNQGLHRDPSLFPAGTFDVVTVELRRRAWHQICSLEFRAAEAKGQEPSISEDDYTTLLPRNIEDEELIEGQSPGATPYNEERWTSMTYQLIRFVGSRASRRIIKSTYRLERRMLESGLHGTSGPDPAMELQTIYQQIQNMVEEMHENNYRKFLRFASTDVPIQRLSLSLATIIEWRCYVLFWLRMPRAFRDVVFSIDVRKSIFEKSVNMIETLNGASADVDAARFQWHIGGHAAFQAIMHVLSELRNPLFDAPNRYRAIRALQLSRLLREQNHARPWQAVKSMIDKLVSEQGSTQSSQLEASPLPYNNTSRATTSLPLNGLAMYPQNPTSFPKQEPPQPIMAPSLEPQPSQVLQPMQTVDPPEIYFNDFNFDNIIGDTQTNGALPEFDFGFWGDPINFSSEPIDFPIDGGYATTWTS
ncbi:hypothetical protein P171DRAFT_357011 [Karstenula rhodostoma CBS 690.94]|uniref:Xylanolytic transcriptional activator regulatory domain-containing protein n=1 Tax=Karstenula rhodostoma CBS 690.94 TaxID=1392251 RepID=A0A9P4PJL1_9PLEO|nr:hypothetical protein P171DRAFT_357011 [Karstenula rhodostoma CBS 690.94]